MAKILCIDDEEYIREDISEFLEGAGHTMLQASDGRMGLEAILKHTPDIVLCDITMPNMDGIELLVELRKNHLEFADMPFIFLSALADRTDVLEGMKLGADDYLTKPLDFEMLVNRIEAFIRQVERMNAKKDQQFVKLFNALSGEVGNYKETGLKNQAEWETVKSAARSEREKTPSAIAKQTAQTSAALDENRTVFGTIFRFENCRNQVTSTGQEIVRWLEEKSFTFLEKVLPKTVSLTKIPYGGILICYPDVDISEVAKQSKLLVRDLEDHLKTDQFDEFVRITTVSKDLLYDLMEISRSDYETIIKKEDLGDPDRFLAAIREQIDEFYADEGIPQKLTQSIKQNNGYLSPLVLLRQDGGRVPITFFDFDELSRQKIKSSSALFSMEILEEAKFQIDLMALDQLKRDIQKYHPIDTVVVDVHFETLYSGDKLALFLTKFITLVESMPYRILINVLDFPAGESNKFLDKLLEPFGDYADRRITQASPRTIEMHANSDILVAGIVVSYFDLVRSQLDASFFLKAKERLSDDGILLMLRSLPSKNEITQFSKFGFNGYAVTSSFKP